MFCSRIVGFMALLQLFAMVSAQLQTGFTITPRSTQASTSTETPSATSRTTLAVHTVKVGSGGHNMDPEELTGVQTGDIVTFEFYPKDHGVARAEFGSACAPYEYTGKGKTGFYSGVQRVDDARNPVHWNLTINSTEPTFYYCTAPDSCQKHQMIGVINPNSTQSLIEQKLAASNADYMVAPGEDIPSEATSSLHIPTSQPTTTAPPPPAPNGHRLSTGAIAGIAVGGVAFLALCAALFFFIGRTRSLKQFMGHDNATVKASTASTPGLDFGHSPATASTEYPYSPPPNQAEFGNLPRYSQHQVSEIYPTGWVTPTGQFSPLMGGQQTAETKPQTQAQYSPQPAEMASPQTQMPGWSAELEAPDRRRMG